MSEWLHLSPLAIALFVILSAFGHEAKKCKAARDRVVKPYIGEVVYGREDAA